MGENGKLANFVLLSPVFSQIFFGEGEIDRFCIYLTLGILSKGINRF